MAEMIKIQTYFLSRPARFYRNLFWGWLSLILLVSSMPYLNTPNVKMMGIEFRTDHIFHWLQYATLAFLMVSWQYRKNPGAYRSVVLYTLLFGLLLAAGDEYHQLLIPGRSFTYADMIANALGVVTGVLIALFFWRPLLKRED
jgi:VanZ family protein